MSQNVRQMADKYEEATSSNYTTPEKDNAQIRICPYVTEEQWPDLSKRTFILLNTNDDTGHWHQLQVHHNKLTFDKQIEHEQLDVKWTVVKFTDPNAAPFIDSYFIYKHCGTMYYLRPMHNLQEYTSAYTTSSVAQSIQRIQPSCIIQPNINEHASPATQAKVTISDTEVTFKNHLHQTQPEDTSSTEDEQSSDHSFQNGQRFTQQYDNLRPPPPTPTSNTSTSNAQSANLLDPIATAMSINNITNVNVDTPTTHTGPQQVAANALMQKDQEIHIMNEFVKKQTEYTDTLQQQIITHQNQSAKLAKELDQLKQKNAELTAAITTHNNNTQQTTDTDIHQIITTLPPTPVYNPASQHTTYVMETITQADTTKHTQYKQTPATNLNHQTIHNTIPRTQTLIKTVRINFRKYRKGRDNVIKCAEGTGKNKLRY